MQNPTNTTQINQVVSKMGLLLKQWSSFGDDIDSSFAVAISLN